MKNIIVHELDCLQNDRRHENRRRTFRNKIAASCEYYEKGDKKEEIEEEIESSSESKGVMPKLVEYNLSVTESMIGSSTDDISGSEIDDVELNEINVCANAKGVEIYKSAIHDVKYQIPKKT